MTVRYADGTLSYKTKYIYNVKGRLSAVIHIPEVFFDGLYGIWRYTYEDDHVQEFKWVDDMGTEYTYDEEGRLVLPNANALMTKLDMGLRVTNIAQNAKFYVIDGNVGMITFDFEGKSYTYKGSKEVRDFSVLSGFGGIAKNFYLIEASGGTVQGFYTVNQYGEGEEITSTVISWKAYEGTEFEAWYVVVCLKNLSESEVNAIVSRVVGI